MTSDTQGSFDFILKRIIHNNSIQFGRFYQIEKFHFWREKNIYLIESNKIDYFNRNESTQVILILFSIFPIFSILFKFGFKILQNSELINQSID